MLPLNEFPLSLIDLTPLISPKDDGILPVKILSAKSNEFLTNTRDPKADGMVPTKQFRRSTKNNKLVKLPNELGLLRFKVTNELKLPIDVGIDP